jgi:serine/threonine protein kinase
MFASGSVLLSTALEQTEDLFQQLDRLLLEETKEEAEDLFRQLDRPATQEQNKESRSYLHDTFNVKELLGEGGYSSVYHCHHKSSQKEYAVKQISTIADYSDDGHSVEREIDVMKALDKCPYVVRLHEVFQDTDYHYLILEKLSGGDLVSALDRKEVFSESEARIVSHKLLQAVAYMHKLKIAHRDIKADNILLNASDTDIKLCDFGCAKAHEDGMMHTMCGSASYVAPEVLRQGGYDQQCDLWSVGVVIFCLLGGYLPFTAEPKKLPALVCSGEFVFHEKYWKDVSDDAKDFIQSLLVVNPAQRYTSQLALTKSKWLAPMSNKDDDHLPIPREIFIPGRSKKNISSRSPLNRMLWGRPILRK